MRKISILLPLILLSIALFGCQQDGKEVSKHDRSKSDEEITSKESNGEYDIEGIVS